MTLSPMPVRRARDVRALLVAQATPAPTPHQPDPHRPGPRRTAPQRTARRVVTGLVAAAAVAGVTTVLVVSGPGTSPAFASWTAVPVTAPGSPPPSDDELALWSSKCTDLTGGGVSIEGVAPGERAARGREVLVDRRGDYTFCVDLSPGSGTAADPLIALAGLRGDHDGFGQTWATTSDRFRFTRPPGDDLLAIGGDGGSDVPVQSDDGAEQVRSVYGPAGPAVIGVRLTLTDGTVVTATVQHGLWAAWWPGRHSEPAADRLTVLTAQGARDVPFSSVFVDVVGP